MPNLSTRTNQMEPQASSRSSLIEPSEYKPADTPVMVAGELSLIRTEVQKGIAVLYDSECKLADAENAYERELQLAFINAQGTVADRTAISRLQASDKRLAADLAKAEYNRVKTKLKALEMAQMSIQTQARLMETELKTLR
jgi:hypothetical protein